VGRSIVLVIAVLGACGLAAAHVGQSQSFTVVDRTMVCTIAYEGGVPDRIRSLSVSISRELGQGEGQFPASIDLGTGRSAALASVRASAASPGTQPTLLVSRRRCKLVKTRVRLIDAERSAPPLDSRTGCKLLDAPRRILVRLRASLQAPARWSVYRRDYLLARGHPLEASLVVRTYPGQKPIAFASFDRSGTARFFAVPRCAE
jgi:hypothetical protein